MEIDKDWIIRFVDTDPEGQEEVLKIALCQKYQRDYSNLITLCENAGLGAERANTVKKWLYRNDYYGYEEDILYEYIKENEPERYKKALTIYYNNRNK